MHTGEVDTDTDLVKRLVRGQFPQWADLPVERLVSGGTVNAVYRLGDALAARLPLTAGGVEDLEWSSTSPLPASATPRAT